MPRIPADRIESIKRDVWIRAVLEARGCAFVKHGPDWACSCPLGTHADSSPSFVVSERKHLWRCHGCGQGGDVVALVQRLNGVSFRHAVELLAAGLPGLPAAPLAGAAGSGSGSAAPLPAVSTRRLLPCPLEAGADDARLADQVVGYYHQRLMEPGNAGLAYLARRGLGDLDFLRRFAFGFADRSLGLRLPAKNRAEGARLRSRLESLGWFRASGHEHLAGSIVVPIHGGAESGNAAGTVVGAYGRKILDNLRAGTPAHLYLSGTHRGVWNHGPDLIDADGAVVVCEALLDAASVWVAGHRAVTAAYGVYGWTDDHDAALRAGRARSVFIAFDADAAGDAGAAALSERLISRGLSVFRVNWPAGLNDANAVLTDRAHGGPAIIDALRTATWLGGAPRVIVPALPSAFVDAVHSGEDENGDSDATVPALAAADPVAVVVALPGAAADAVSLEQLTPFSSSPLTNGLPHAVTPAPVLLSVPKPVPAPAPALPPGVSVADHGADVLVSVGTRAYRVRGLDRARDDALRVNLRLVVRVAGPGAGRSGGAKSAAMQPVDRVHVDTIDLYQARQRAAFAAAAAAEIGMSVDVLRDDLGAVLLAVEVVMHQRASAAAATTATGGNAGKAGGTTGSGASADPTAPTMTADEEAAARALLMAPDVLDQIAADLGRCGLVGEERNKRAAMLACVSRLTDQPLAVLVQSTSAAGKTTLMDAVLSFLPDSAVRRYSAMSGKSAFYLGSTPIKHRVLAIAEEEGARRASYALKLLQSDGKLTMAATGKDPESGRLVTHDYTVEGPVMLFLTTTAIDLDPELVNRCLVLAVDESPEQTAAIHAAQRDARTLAGLAKAAERAAIRRRHQHAQTLLR